ncbi:hypothetical protein NQ318_020968 [Aromia moschata]|uniref:GAF domain-containing protein n=1 Tax=Aromia moschata TaxID=1265417 RepID=A0AAV8YN05_9CUCU|nr:hypothetical protein NQ318_020968 [Aromia moschata]
MTQLDVLKTTTKAYVRSFEVLIHHPKKFIRARLIPTERHKVNWKIQKGTTVAAYVAYKKEYIMVDDILGDDRFPAGLGYEDEMIKSVLCVPVIEPDGQCYAVIELYREVTQPPFVKDDMKISIVVTGWAGAAIHQNSFRLALQKKTGAK